MLLLMTAGGLVLYALMDRLLPDEWIERLLGPGERDRWDTGR